jgi:hypothetical protein
MSAAGQSWLMPGPDDEPEEIVMRLKAFTGLLVRLAQAESR